MQILKISVATAGFGLPLRDAVRRAASIGAQGLLLDARYEIQPHEFTESARKQFQHLLGELGLKLIGFQFPLRRPLADPTDLDLRIDSLRKAISLAALFQVRLVTFRVGPIPELDESKPAAEFCRILEDLALHGNHVGVIPAITPAGESPERLKALLDRIKTGFIGIDCDPSLNLTTKHRSTELIRTLHDRISHVRIRDALRDLDGQIREMVVGRGEVDWTELIPTLQEVEYQGWLTVSRTDGPDRIGDSARAIEYLRQLFWGN